jgi:hypothetical protein
MGKNLHCWVDEYGYMLILSIPVYPWVKYTRIITTITI